MSKQIDGLIEYLGSKKKVLFLTTSNRWEDSKEIPKSTLLAMDIQKKLENTTDVSLLEIPKLKIYPCEGNVSGVDGNNCGVKDSILKDDEKNPSGNHRCWASINNQDDELWKVSKEIYESENTVSEIEAGCVIIGQNWNGEQVLETQKQVYEFYGFKVPDEISFYWQYTQDTNDESQESYKEAPKSFGKEFEISINRLKESLNNGFNGLKRLFDFN